LLSCNLLSIRLKQNQAELASTLFCKERANGLRYPLVGETRQRYFDGTNLKPQKLPENAHAKRPTIRTPMLVRGSGARCVGQILQDDFELWFLPCKLIFNHFLV
jgi:hypothetical protein